MPKQDKIDALLLKASSEAFENLKLLSELSESTIKLVDIMEDFGKDAQEAREVLLQAKDLISPQIDAYITNTVANLMARAMEETRTGNKYFIRMYTQFKQQHEKHLELIHILGKLQDQQTHDEKEEEAIRFFLTFSKSFARSHMLALEQSFTTRFVTQKTAQKIAKLLAPKF